MHNTINDYCSRQQLVTFVLHVLRVRVRSESATKTRIINPPDRTTYFDKKSVRTSEATRNMRRSSQFVTLATMPILAVACAAALAQQTMTPDGRGGYVIKDKSGCNALFGTAAGR